MEFLVLSQSRAKKFTYKESEIPYIIISITDRGAENVVFNQNEQLKNVLRVNFDDTDVEGTNAITQEDAKKIIDFVKRWKEEVQLVVVHCGAGVSRSAGVCAALMLWLNGDDKFVFDNKVYQPNMRCYRVILNELLEREWI